jgi:diguanylate cyclase (GGDEF)-like protein/PAS domain S-box-containing protein
MVLAMAPFLLFRQVLSGHFRARHDRSRLHGLFEATLEAHSSMGASEVRSAITGAARDLLRCSDAALSSVPPSDGQIGARLQVELPERWLVLSGRRRDEPFDEADRALLDALAAVGSGALTNAALFEARRIEHERLTAMTTALGEGVCALDQEGRVTFANPAACELLGRDAARLVTLSHADPDTLTFLTGPARRAMATRATVHTEAAMFTRRDGSSFPVSFTCSPIVDSNVVVGAVMAFRDITERKAFEERLSHQAFHDALTGLPNRRVFLDRLEHALRRSQRDHGIHAVLFIDVDRFKIANDSLGHQAGDHLLMAIADRMRVLLRPVDTLARFGGDEFTVLLEDVASVDDATTVARRILDTLHTAIVVPGGHEVVASVSIGIALSAGRASADDVLHDADVAMYQAKTRGAGRFAVFDAGAMGARSSDRVDLEADLRRAIQTTGIEVFYQPLVRVDSREVSGAEALVRWRHPERGLLGPADFIALAEESGLILPLGRMVLEEACRQARIWRESTGRPWRVSVNLSARQFQSPDLLADVRRILSVTGVDPAQICLEITETVAVQDLEHTIGTLNELKRLGVKLAIDDFGTGYSSLSYLKRFPVDVVKIDRVFVKDLGESRVDSAIVAAVIDLAGVVGMQVVAEGVETIEQLNHLEMLGCAIVQGFLFGRPVPEPEMTRLLRPLEDSIPLPLAIAG